MSEELDIQMFHDKSWKPDLYWGQKVKVQGHESQKQCGRGSWYSSVCWLLLLWYCKQFLDVKDA